MDITTVGIIGGIVVIVVVFFAFKNRKSAEAILQNNTDVVPLLLQKSTQNKVTRLQQATQADTQNNELLQRLVAAYKNGQLSIQQYNDKLDAMITRLEVEL